MIYLKESIAKTLGFHGVTYAKGAEAGPTPPVITVTPTLKDLFTTDQAAPLGSPRTAEPGPGTWTVVETDGQLSIVGQELIFPFQVTPVQGDLMIYSEGFSRENGIGLIYDTKLLQSGSVMYGVANTVPFSLTTQMEHYFFIATHVNFRSAYQNQVPSFTTDSFLNQQQKVGLVTRATGAFYIKDNQLFWVDNTYSNTPLYPFVSVLNSRISLNSVKVGALGSPWTGQFGPGYQVSASSATAGTTFTHEANFVLHAKVSNRGSAGATIFQFRKQDADNYWSVSIDYQGIVDIIETVAGVPTVRGTTGGGVIANNERFGLVVGLAGDDRIYFCDSTANRVSYYSATNFSTATNGELSALATGAVIDDFEVYPMDLSGDALTWWEALENS